MNMKIKITDFLKQYKNHTVKIDDIVINGRVSLIVGQNGSGKSTLLKAIGGIIKYSGNIECDHRVCYMDEFFSFPSDIELFTFLKLLNSTSVSPKKEEYILQLLDYFNLTDKQAEDLKSLSKGMKAKVNIIQCLLEGTDIYLLDEPLSGLDKEGIELFKNYITKSKNNFVISTHLDDELRGLSDEVIYL